MGIWLIASHLDGDLRGAIHIYKRPIISLFLMVFPFFLHPKYTISSILGPQYIKHHEGLDSLPFHPPPCFIRLLPTYP